MSSLNPRKSRPILPYWASILIWAALGPLGGGPASCGRWVRACAEAGCCLGGIMLFSLATAGDRGSLEDLAWAPGMLDGQIDPVLGWASALLLSASLALWIGDFWRIGSWHGRKADPLLDSTTDM